ncbi:MAG: hypothetical protein QY325_04185 [Flavobacteriales bacterium]|nr:MAG: hypothetical protein QY325_04185 [Flavobacteriales bacterium]
MEKRLSSRNQDQKGKTEAQLAIERHLAARKLPADWLIKRLGMTNGSYYGIFQRGSERYDFLRRVAEAMGLTVVQLLSAPAPKPGADAEPATTVTADPPGNYRRRYIEDRIEDLERRMDELERKR